MSNFGKVFVSYARHDIDYLYKLRRAAGPHISALWWDAKLSRSDPNWRRSITNSIENASAVFVLCSPNARQSEAVTSEIEIARSHGKQIYCFWIFGESWAQSAPFSVLTYNYTDIRTIEGEPLATLFAGVLREIAEQLPPHFEFIDGDLAQPLLNDVHLVAFGKRRIFIRSGHVGSVLDLANLLQEHYLQREFEAFSYGKKWCLASGVFLFLPFECLVDKTTDNALLIALHNYLQKQLPPAQLQLVELKGDVGKIAYGVLYPNEFSHAMIGMPRGKVRQLPLLEEINRRDAQGLRSAGYGEICILASEQPEPVAPDFSIFRLLGASRKQNSTQKPGKLFEFKGNIRANNRSFD